MEGSMSEIDLLAVESLLDKRILLLENIICGLQAWKLSAAVSQSALVEPSDQIKEQSETKKLIESANSNVSETISSDEKQLDDILAMARDIRSMNKRGKESKKKIESESKSSKTLIKGEKVEEKKRKPPISINNTSKQKAIQSKAVEKQEIISESKIEKLSPFNQLCDYDGRFHTMDKFIRESANFSDKKSNINQTVEKSKIYDLISKDLPKFQSSSLIHENLEENKDSKINILVRLKYAFKELISNYERYLKGRLNRLSFNQLTSKDRDDILYLWLKGRKLMELYDYYQKRRKICSCENCRENNEKINFSSISNLNKKPLFTPLITPTDMMKSIKNVTNTSKIMKNDPNISIAIEKWYENAQDKVASFHTILEKEIKYSIEYDIGQNKIKEVVKRLKSCCEKESMKGKDQKNDEILRKEWMDSLQYFRVIYSILVMEASNQTICTFLHKI